MKTAISLPDALFEHAEQMAQYLGLNRSQLYALALREFLEKHDPAVITATFDTIYSPEASALDPVLVELQAASTPDEEW